MALALASTAISHASPPISAIGPGELAKIFGRVQIVEAFPDYKVKVVAAFPDLKVKRVAHFADGPGLWQFVDAFPDFKIQFVDAFPDFTIKYVDAFPGVDQCSSSRIQE